MIITNKTQILNSAAAQKGRLCRRVGYQVRITCSFSIHASVVRTEKSEIYTCARFSTPGSKCYLKEKTWSGQRHYASPTEKVTNTNVLEKTNTKPLNSTVKSCTASPESQKTGFSSLGLFWKAARGAICAAVAGVGLLGLCDWAFPGRVRALLGLSAAPCSALFNWLGGSAVDCITGVWGMLPVFEFSITSGFISLILFNTLLDIVHKLAAKLAQAGYASAKIAAGLTLGSSVVKLGTRATLFMLYAVGACGGAAVAGTILNSVFIAVLWVMLCVIIMSIPFHLAGNNARVSGVLVVALPMGPIILALLVLGVGELLHPVWLYYAAWVIVRLATAVVGHRPYSEYELFARRLLGNERVDKEQKLGATYMQRQLSLHAATYCLCMVQFSSVWVALAEAGPTKLLCFSAAAVACNLVYNGFMCCVYAPAAPQSPISRLAWIQILAHDYAQVVFSLRAFRQGRIAACSSAGIAIAIIFALLYYDGVIATTEPQKSTPDIKTHSHSAEQRSRAASPQESAGSGVLAKVAQCCLCGKMPVHPGVYTPSDLEDPAGGETAPWGAIVIDPRSTDASPRSTDASGQAVGEGPLLRESAGRITINFPYILGKGAPLAALAERISAWSAQLGAEEAPAEASSSVGGGSQPGESTSQQGQRSRGGVPLADRPGSDSGSLVGRPGGRPASFYASEPAYPHSLTGGQTKTLLGAPSAEKPPIGGEHVEQPQSQPLQGPKGPTVALVPVQIEGSGEPRWQYVLTLTHEGEEFVNVRFDPNKAAEFLGKLNSLHVECLRIMAGNGVAGDELKSQCDKICEFLKRLGAAKPGDPNYDQVVEQASSDWEWFLQYVSYKAKHSFATILLFGLLLLAACSSTFPEDDFQTTVNRVMGYMYKESFLNNSLVHFGVVYFQYIMDLITFEQYVYLLKRYVWITGDTRTAEDLLQMGVTAGKFLAPSIAKLTESELLEYKHNVQEQLKKIDQTKADNWPLVAIHNIALTLIEARQQNLEWEKGVQQEDKSKEKAK